MLLLMMYAYSFIMLHLIYCALLIVQIALYTRTQMFSLAFVTSVKSLPTDKVNVFRGLPFI